MNDMAEQLSETPAPRRAGRRWAVLGAAAVVLIGVAVAGGVALMPRSHPAPAASAAGAPSVPPAAPSAAEGGTLGAGPSAGGANPVPNVIPGTLVYQRETGGQLAYVRVTGGVATTVSFGPVTGADQAATLSPDGIRVAMVVTSNYGNVAPGDLVVVSPGGARRTLAHDVAWDGGEWPVWTPDGGRLMFVSGQQWKRVTVADGTVTPLSGVQGSYLTWSPTGAYLAYYEWPSGKVVVARPDRTVVSRTSTTGMSACPAPADEGGCTPVTAVSDDGRYVAVGETNTDPKNVTEPAFVLDTRTGSAVSLPVAQGSLPAKVYFRAGGGMLVQAGQPGDGRTLTLVGPDGRAGAPVPDPDPQDMLVGYRP